MTARWLPRGKPEAISEILQVSKAEGMETDKKRNKTHVFLKDKSVNMKKKNARIIFLPKSIIEQSNFICVIASCMDFVAVFEKAKY